MEYNFTTENFEEEVLKSELPVLVDFYADWCGPCKMMAPIVEEIAEKFEGRLKVGKCNIDENLQLTQKYRIVSIPTFKIFKNGDAVATFIGGMGAEEFEEQIESALQKQI
jgi:thioredoxin 1